MPKLLEHKSRVYNFKGSEAKINAIKAASIARKFLEQYHSPVIFRSANLNNKTWMISMEIGLIKDDVIEVSIDSETGKILGYNH